MTLTYQSIGPVGLSGVGATSIITFYPASIAAGETLTLVVLQKPSTADSGTVTTPAGWTLQGSSAWEGGYGATLGQDTGDLKWYVYSKDTVLGTESATGTMTVTIGTNNVCAAYIIRTSNSGGTISYGFGTGGDSSAGTPMSVTCGSDPGIAAGDLLICGFGQPTIASSTIRYSGQTITATGVTVGAVTEIADSATTTGAFSLGWNVFYAQPSAGPSSAAPVIEAAIAGVNTDARGPGFMLRIRETSAFLGLAARIAALITSLGADIKKAAPFEISFMRPGTLATFTGPRIYFPDDVELMAASFELTTAPTGSSAIFEILKNGAATFSADPAISASGFVSSAGTLTGTTLFTARTDYLQVQCTQKGSTIAGADLTATLKLKLS